MIEKLNNEQDNNNSTDNKIINIDKNISDVKNYSIINKSINELSVVKKDLLMIDFINKYNRWSMNFK